MAQNTAAGPRVLIVSNQQTTSPLWVLHSPHMRIQPILETDPAKTVQRWIENTPDMVVFDIDPAESLALQWVRNLRGEAIIPILLLSPNRTEQFMLEAYEAGVDECVVKPISPALFYAKMSAWLRRSRSIPIDLLEPRRVGNINLISSERTLLLDNGIPIHLTFLELRLLYYLMGRPGRAVSTEELCLRMWGDEGAGNIMTLKNVVYRLRRKIEADPANPRYVRTVPGVGYQFMAK